MSRSIRFVAMAVLVLLAVQLVPAFAASSAAPSQPASVMLTIIPPKLPADGGVYPAAVVSLVDSSNLPTAAISNVTIFLTSSQTNIAAVPDTVTIAAGQEYVIANVTTTNTPGTAMITASAQGLTSKPQVSVSVPLSTVIPSGFPSKLLVLTSPSTFLPGSGQGVVRVEVVDAAGLPSKAISSIPIQLSSSNASIAHLDQTSLTIPEGNIFSADGTFSTHESGSAVIAATSSGYASGAGLVTVNKPNALTGPSTPYKLSLRVVAAGSPGALPADGQTYNVLQVGLATSSGSPAVTSSDTVVLLTSDNPNLASVQSLVTIPAGSPSILTQVTTSALAGVANVTAAAAGLVPGTVPVKMIIPAPSKLQTYVAPTTSAYFANGNYPILVVQLQDSSGNPARARQDTSVVVTSSNGSLLSNFVTVGIPKGSDYVFSYLHTKGVGSSVLTASSQDLVSSQSNLKSVRSPLLARLLLTSTSLPYIYDNQTATFEFVATFDGVPVQNMNVTWTTTGGTIVPQTGNTRTSGSTSTTFTPGAYGAYNITASAESPATGPLKLVYRLTVAEVPAKPAPSLVEQILGFWYYIVAAVAVAAVAMVYLFRMRRKKQRAEIEAGFEVV